jgi:hypothetical protein
MRSVPAGRQLGMGDARIYPDGLISSAAQLDRVRLRRILAGLGRRHRLLTRTRSRPEAGLMGPTRPVGEVKRRAHAG